MRKNQDVPGQDSQSSMYQAALLKVIINHTGIKGVFSRAAQVVCDNFNHCKLDFHSKKKFKSGERVILDLCIGSVVASELEAVITAAEHHGESWHYQADFCLERKHMSSPTISRALLFIEQKLRIQASYPIN